MSEQPSNKESFRLSSGGLFYDLLVCLHIQARGSYATRRRIIILATLCWLPLLVLTAIEGNLYSHQLDFPFILDFKSHIRYLLILPLLIVADSVIDPLISSNLQSIGASGLIRDEHSNVYQKAIDRFTQKKNAYLPDLIILLLLVLVVSSFVMNLDETATSNLSTDWVITQTASGAALTWAGWWFALISTPILLILLLRWMWRFLLWVEFLFKVSRMPLRLQSTHPDLSGGLGILRNGENSFLVVFFAFGAMLSTSLAEEILLGGLTLAAALPMASVYILTAIIIMTIPMLFFVLPLIRAKRYGRIVYGSLGYRLSQAFDKKWGDTGDTNRGDELLKTADASAVCDYSDVYGAVRDMRYLPITLRNLGTQAFILSMPFAPLVFTELPFSKVLSLLLNTLM